MSLEQVEMPVKVIVSDAQTHAGLFGAVVAQGQSPHDALFAEGAVVIIHEKQAGGGIAGNVDIRPTVFVEIGGHNGHAITFRRGRDPGLLADVGKRSIAIVAIKRMPAHRQPARTTLHRNSLPVAVNVFSGYGSVLKREADIIGNEKIQMPVPVVVEETATCAPACLLGPKS